MGIILWIILGGLAGWIASMIMGTDAQMGALANIILGIIGGVVGGLIMMALGFSSLTGFNIYSMLVAILGSVVVIWLVRVIR